MSDKSEEFAAKLVHAVRDVQLEKTFRVMNVCGGHERTISMSGLRTVLPKSVELIPGPGCPVCVCPEEDILAAIHLALSRHVTLMTFGDMLRVPINGSKSKPRSLEQARAIGGDVRAISGPREAVNFAKSSPNREVVLFVAGFETTVAPVAALIAEGLPPNMSVLLSGRRTRPAVEMLLASEQAGFDALIAPGHVSAIMGPEEWGFVADLYSIPTAIAGFDTNSMLMALHSLMNQHLTGRSFLDNCYGWVAKPQGNPTARDLLQKLMNVIDANWRGIGVIQKSGFELKPELSAIDARYKFGIWTDSIKPSLRAMPPGCDCARVVLGKAYPHQCRLYGKACTPRRPIGPCMVSEEGACRIWWSAGIHQAEGDEEHGGRYQ